MAALHGEKRLAQWRRYREANREKVLERQRAWREANRERTRTYALNTHRADRDTLVANMKTRRLENPSKGKAYSKAYREKNRGAILAKNALRRARKLKAQPSWVDKKAITAIYEVCSNLTRTSGIKWNVDHRVPLKSSVVCGLHVPWNLEIIPASLNFRKYNKVLS